MLTDQEIEAAAQKAGGRWNGDTWAFAMIEFDECSNYRGALQAKEENGKFFWRVDCDVGAPTEWREIPSDLYQALERHHSRNDGHQNDLQAAIGGLVQKPQSY